MKRIGKLGEFPATYGVSDVKLERKGFLSVLSYKPSDVSHRYEMMERGSAAFVLPVDWARREVYLLRAPRHLRAFTTTPEGSSAVLNAMIGNYAAPFEVPASLIVVWDVPAGIVEWNETFGTAAVRELEEEAGIRISLDQLGHDSLVYASIGGTTELLYLTIGDVGRQYESVAPKGDGDECMEVWRLSFEEVFKLLDEGEIANAGGHILLQKLRILDLERQLASAKG